MIFRSDETCTPPVIPRIETGRLVLRGHVLGDLDAAAAMWADPDITRFIGNQPRPRAMVWQTLQRNVGSWGVVGYGYWVIEDRATGEFLGEIGFMEGQRDMTPPIAGSPEAGWVLARAAWGRGVATEALGAALGWADAHLACDRTTCIIDPENGASLKVANRHGYQVIRTTRFMESDIHVLERLRRAPG